MQNHFAIVNLKHIRHNVTTLKRLACGRKFIAVVKANAYGHGAAEVARAIEPLCDGFAVSNVFEGISLRQSGIFKPILVFTPPLDRDDIYFAFMHDLTLTINSLACLRLVRRVILELNLGHGMPLSVHIKVNSGMNRLGACGKSLQVLCKQLALAEKNGEIITEGIYSHLYAPQSENASLEQLERFQKERRVAQDILQKPLFSHISATGGILRGEKFLLDGVRGGIGIYGYYPFAAESAPRLEPAMKVYSRVLQSFHFTGGGIGYGEQRKGYRGLTTYACGYADGFSREGELRRGQVGNLCMDSHICAGTRTGSNRFGRRRLLFNNAQKVAERNHTIVYTVLTSATRRAHIEYIE